MEEKAIVATFMRLYCYSVCVSFWVHVSSWPSVHCGPVVPSFQDLG